MSDLVEFLAWCEKRGGNPNEYSGPLAELLRRVGAFHFEHDVYDGEEDWNDWNGALVGRGPRYRQEMGPELDPTLFYSDYAHFLELGTFARTLVAAHPSTPDDVEILLAKDSEAVVRRAVAKRRPACLDALALLIDDPNIVGAVASNPTVSGALLEQAMTRKVLTEHLYKNPNSTAVVLRHVFQHLRPKESKSWQATMIWPLLEHPNTPLDVLEGLLDEGLHPKAKEKLLARRDLPPELIERIRREA